MSEMATSSLSPTSPTPPPLPELDKILLQDMLAERAKIRDGIPDTLRYAGIVLTAMIAFGVNAPPPTSQPILVGQPPWFAVKMQAISWLSFVLVLGFAIKLNEMMVRLRSLNERINRKLNPLGEEVDDQEMLKYGRTLIRFTALPVLIVMYYIFHLCRT